jgi:CheY-like chemotaxis protein
MAKKILVVDDEFSDLETIKSVLEKNKYNVDTATNGAQVMDILAEKNGYNLILIDIKMPTLSGYDLLRLLKERAHHTKLAFISIVPENEVELDDVDGFIQKPFTPDSLLKIVRDMVGE